MMPCAQYEALEACRQDQCERGVTSNEETDQGNNDSMEEEQEDLDDPPE
jgi:hypothetical protein